MMYQLFLISLEGNDYENQIIRDLVNKSLEKLNYSKFLKLYHLWATN